MKLFGKLSGQLKRLDGKWGMAIKIYLVASFVFILYLGVSFAVVNISGLLSHQMVNVTKNRLRAILIKEELIPNNADYWEIFDVKRWNNDGFSRSVNMRREITDVVAEYIKALDDVDDANVIICFPEYSSNYYNPEGYPVSVSVVIKPAPHSDILQNRLKIEGIQKILLYAIPGLSADYIVITDNFGFLINDFSNQDA